MAQYLFWLIPFFVSFATASGDLNNNFYIKLFAFEFAFILMFVYNAYKKERNFRIAFSISYPDVLIIGLLIIYFFYFYAGYCNIIDHSVSLIYLLFYFFIRSNFDNKSVDALIKKNSSANHSIAFINMPSAIFQNNSNYSIYFEVGSTFGNPDMLSAYLAVLLPFLLYRESQMDFLSSINSRINSISILLFTGKNSNSYYGNSSIVVLCSYETHPQDVYNIRDIGLGNWSSLSYILA